MTETRHRVPEWRITQKIGDGDDFLLVRWWIEADPRHGGVEKMWDANLAVVDVLHKIMDKMKEDEEIEVSILAHRLLNAYHPANSVEITNALGNGITIHADWP